MKKRTAPKKPQGIIYAPKMSGRKLKNEKIKIEEGHLVENEKHQKYLLIIPTIRFRD